MSAPTFLPMLATCRWISSRMSVFFLICEVRVVFSAISDFISSVLRSYEERSLRRLRQHACRDQQSRGLDASEHGEEQVEQI